jgi:hypothetical protein
LAFDVDAADPHVRGAARGDEQLIHGGDVVVPSRLLPDHDGAGRGGDDGDETGELAPLVQIERRDGARKPGVDAKEPDHRVAT